MREYRPQRSAVLFFGALSVMCLGLDAFVLQALLTMRRDSDLQAMLWMYIPVLLLIGLAAGFCIRLLLVTLASYRVDPRGITQIVLGRQQTFLWQDVVDFQSGRLGQFGAAWTLTNRSGRKLKIPTCLMARGYGLEGFLHAYSASVREQKRTQLPLSPQVYRYGKAPGIFLLVIGLFFLCFIVGAFAASVAQPGPDWPVVLAMSVIVFGGFGGLSVGLALHFFTYAVRLTPEAITESSLFSTKTLPFQEIAAFYAGEVPGKNGQMQKITEIVGKNGKRIKINAQLIDYDALTAALRASMPTPVLEQGQREKAVTGRISRRQEAKILMIFGPLLLLLMLGISALLSGDSITGLERQNRLDREGRTIRGVVTGNQSKSEGRSATGYYLDFEFQIAGQTYRKSSPVDRDTYHSLSQGSPTEVLYLPSDPTISRMAASIGRRKAIGQLVGFGLYVLLAIPTGLYMFFRGWKVLRAEDETLVPDKTGEATP